MEEVVEEELAYLRKENERLYKELDIALEKAFRYDRLVDTLFDTLLKTIARKALD